MPGAEVGRSLDMAAVWGAKRSGALGRVQRLQKLPITRLRREMVRGFGVRVKGDGRGLSRRTGLMCRNFGDLEALEKLLQRLDAGGVLEAVLKFANGDGGTGMEVASGELVGGRKIVVVLTPEQGVSEIDATARFEKALQVHDEH